MEDSSPKSKGRIVLGHVLVTDDDPQMRRVCSRALSNEGWQVTLAENGKAAIDAVRDAINPFDCVVSDVNMPELDGFELIEAIRKHDDDLPVLLMTGDPTLDGAVRAINNGAVSYLSKPFDQEMLVAAVARAARRHGVARMRRRAESGEMATMRDEVGLTFDRALAQVWMAFQPIVRATDRSVFGYEALLRTEEPTLIRPDLVVDAAERLSSLPRLGRKVRALAAAAMSAAEPDAALDVVDLFDRGALGDLQDHTLRELRQRRLGVEQLFVC